MLSKNTLKVVGFLLKNIQEYNINQIARNLGISVGSSYNILKALEKDKLIKPKKLGNAIYYRLNLEDDQAQKVAELVLLEAKNKTLQKNPKARIYADDIKKAKAFSRAALLFGSVLEKKEPADIDVLFIVNKRAVKEIENFCLKLSSLRPKRIIPLIMTAKDLKNNLKKQDSVIMDILKKGVVLYGEDKIIDILRSI